MVYRVGLLHAEASAGSIPAVLVQFHQNSFLFWVTVMWIYEIEWRLLELCKNVTDNCCIISWCDASGSYKWLCSAESGASFGKTLIPSHIKILPLSIFKTHSCIGVSQCLDHRELVCVANRMLSSNNIHGNRGLWETERVKFIPFGNLNASYGHNS